MKLWTETLIPTLKESPAEAEITSHKLLLRAGLVRKLGGGLYTYMPLGLRVLEKLKQICREEMEAAGGIEVLMPARCAASARSVTTTRSCSSSTRSSQDLGAPARCSPGNTKTPAPTP